MYDFVSESNLIIQALLMVVMVGVFYNLMVTTRAYGGIIGRGLRMLGIGIIFFCISLIERSLVNFSILEPTLNASLTQDILSLAGLTFSGIGFTYLARAAKK